MCATETTLKKAIRDCLHAPKESLERVFAEAELISIDDKIKAILEVTGMTKKKAVKYANLDTDPTNKIEWYETVMDAFYSDKWSRPTLASECADALKHLALVYGWKTLAEVGYLTQAFKHVNTQKILNRYLRAETYLEDNLTEYLKTLEESDDDVLEYIEDKIEETPDGRDVERVCIFDKYNNKFVVSEIESTLEWTGKGWELSFRGNKKIPKKPSLPLGQLPLHKAVEEVRKYYAKHFKRDIELSANILDAFLGNGEGTEKEKEEWRKLRCEAEAKGF